MLMGMRTFSVAAIKRRAIAAAKFEDRTMEGQLALLTVLVRSRVIEIISGAISPSRPG
jgi:hypothetical protein